jgi:hypothetical protein
VQEFHFSADTRATFLSGRRQNDEEGVSGIIVLEDDFKRARIEFREREGRGYWRGKDWREF